MFLAAVNKPLSAVPLGDVQAYTDQRRHLVRSTPVRTSNTLRSHFRFRHTIGYLPGNMARSVRPLAVKHTLAEGILSERDVYRMVLLPVAAWRTLQELDPGVPDAPVCRSRAGGHISTVPEWRIVRKAARDAGILADVSPHFLRHAYARLATTSTYT